MQLANVKDEAQEKAAEAKDRLAAARERWPSLDHLIRAVQHYGAVLGGQLAGAVTYFGFLSFFPIVALAFAVTGYVVAYVPGADEAVTAALNSVLPGMIGDDPGKINVTGIASRKAGVGIIGLAGLLYSGLGWVSALRTSLQGVFEVVLEEKRNFVVGKVIDLVVLATIGVVLVVSVSLSTVVVGFTDTVVDVLGLTAVPGMGVILWLAATVVGVAANTLLFFTMYRLLPKHHAPTRAVWQGAAIAALGFEVLKQLASVVIGGVTSNALYGAFAIMIALLVWINYFARLAVLGACWAATADTEEGGTEEGGTETNAPPGRGTRALLGAASVAGVVAIAVGRSRSGRRG